MRLMRLIRLVRLSRGSGRVGEERAESCPMAEAVCLSGESFLSAVNKDTKATIDHFCL